MTSETAILDRLHELGATALKEQLFSHASFQMGFLDDSTFDQSFLWTNVSENAAEVFDLSSLTKALVTTPLALCYTWQRQKLETAVLGEIFPEAAFKGIEAAQELRLCDVLRHEAGLPAWRNFYTVCLGETGPSRQGNLQVLARAVSERHQSPRNLYSDIGMIVLGHLLTESQGKSLAEQYSFFVENELCIPQDQAPAPGWKFKPEACVTTGWCEVRLRQLRGEVHDENAWALGGFPGHSGLFGTCRQVSDYLRALRRSRVGGEVLRKNFQWAAISSQSDSALGFRTGRDASSQVFGGGNAVGHWGFTGTAFWVDPVLSTFASD